MAKTHGTWITQMKRIYSGKKHENIRTNQREPLHQLSILL